MKTHFYITLLCFALAPCNGHKHLDNEHVKTTEADPPFPYPSSESPKSNDYFAEEEHGGGGHSYTSFSSAFKDVLQGTVRGNSESTMKGHGGAVISEEHQQALRQICSHTDYPDLCCSTVSPFIGNHLDVMHVLEAAIKACLYQTNFTLTKVSKHMKRSPEMAGAFADCKEQYTDATLNLKRAMDAIPLRDLGTVTVMLSAVMADVSACESGFADLKSASPVGHSEGLVTITASISLSIASSIPN
ncbi:hypothetical protein Fmac_009617 [Flemingia macrophylla]|uniref:Pectinesterase inhibitor domain-containing protein n=1 Tax=Flemingia macrophylla TaxID=520843 RepID=A0ABD1N0S6_9FABA